MRRGDNFDTTTFSMRKSYLPTNSIRLGPQFYSLNRKPEVTDNWLCLSQRVNTHSSLCTHVIKQLKYSHEEWKQRRKCFRFAMQPVELPDAPPGY